MENDTPDIYNISWVTKDNFNPDNLTTSKQETSSPGLYERGKLMYAYTPESQQRDLVVTVPRTPEAYITCRGVQKDMFSKGDVKVETNRYGAQLILNANNVYHIALYELFSQVMAKVHELTGSTVSFPVKDMDGYSIIYTNLIHSNDGKMFSSAYTADEQIDILNCKKCIVRPALMLSTIRKSPTEVKIRVQISQMYVHKEIKDFPLAHND